MKTTSIIILFLAFVACSEPTPEKITNPEEYNTYLLSSNTTTFDEAVSKKDFWNKRLAADSSGVGDLGPLAAAYAQLFETTGNVEHLRNAEKLYRKAMDISANNKDSYARALAHNLISQHRFKEAKTILEESYGGVSNKHETELMLFDIAMELGEYDAAYRYLGKVKNNSDYHYLIRAAKWSDYKGDLDNAIKNMEKAKEIAESRNSTPLKIWTYSNLGDYYGHAGRIEESYNHYLKTLELQPDNAYAKKGIAWIAYSRENNPEEANRILDSVMRTHKVPDYYLLKAELAQHQGAESEVVANEQKFISAVDNESYGPMYNAYLIEYFAETDPDRALQLAREEVANRATPETYHLLALAQLKADREMEALKTIEEHVVGKTFEPMAQYHTALVYKANGMEDKVAELKQELEEASYELGPVLSKKIEKL
ncbi:MAG: hypothetical protein CMC08_01025 [Flavobacteriaceae bacterium]|nr:hypothetical protein [Flavobacteriaceae bacterium]